MRHACLAAIALIAFACTVPTAVPSPSKTVTTTTSATPIATSEASASRTTASPSVQPSPATPLPQASIVANALGPLTGDWVFYAQRVPRPGNSSASMEVWGISPSGQQRLAVSYVVSLGGIPEALIDNTLYLRRQFSPDGRQLVVSARDEGLVVVDLTTGHARQVASQGSFPSWSKDGKTIAYLATATQTDPQRAPSDRAIWVVPATGGTPRELINVGFSSTAAEWSADSTRLYAQLADGVGLVDVSTGREIPGTRIPHTTFTTGMHWPAGRSDAAVTVIRDNDTQLIVWDDAARVWRFVAQFPRPADASSCNCPQGLVASDPKWNPTGNGELLFLLRDEKIDRTSVDVLDDKGLPTALIADALFATWSSDGTRVLYIARSAQGLGAAIHGYDRATRADRVLVTDPSPTTHRPSVAAVSY